MNSIGDYKGLILITFIIVAILYFSPDLECMLLFTGILVNIITICLNTGALKLAAIKKSGGTEKSNFTVVPESFISACDCDNVEKFLDEPPPRFDHLAQTDELEKDINRSIIKKQPKMFIVEEEPKPIARSGQTESDVKLRYKRFPPVSRYKGAIDVNDASEPMQIGADRIPLVSTVHAGGDPLRSKNQAYGKWKTLYPAVSEELEQSESKYWYGNYDQCTTINPPTAPYG